MQKKLDVINVLMKQKVAIDMISNSANAVQLMAVWIICVDVAIWKHLQN